MHRCPLTWKSCQNELLVPAKHPCVRNSRCSNGGVLAGLGCLGVRPASSEGERARQESYAADHSRLQSALTARVDVCLLHSTTLTFLSLLSLSFFGEAIVVENMAPKHRDGDVVATVSPTASQHQQLCDLQADS